MELFRNTEPANFCYGVVWCSSFKDIPVDVERDALSDEIPDILDIHNYFNVNPVLIITCYQTRIHTWSVIILPPFSAGCKFSRGTEEGRRGRV